MKNKYNIKDILNKQKINKKKKKEKKEKKKK